MAHNESSLTASWEEVRTSARQAAAQEADELVRTEHYAEAFVALTSGEQPVAEQKTAVELLAVMIGAQRCYRGPR